MTHQLEVIAEVIFHATEDKKKIFEPIFDLFQIREEEFTVEKTLGHYGNTIIIAKVKLVKRRAEDFIKKLVSRIKKPELDELIENIELHFEDSAFFLRIGKNELVSKEISLQQNNAIKIKIKMPVYKKDEIVKKYTELLVDK